jgi:protein Mpv17
MKLLLSLLTVLFAPTLVHSFQLSSISNRNHVTRQVHHQPSSHSILPASSTKLHAAPIEVMITMYKQSLLDNPLQTKLLTGGILAFIGDAVAQSREPEYDKKRAGAFVSFDLIYRAVQCSLFPHIVDICDGHSLATVLPDIDLHFLATIEQTFANQFLVIPLIYYPVFFSLTGYLQGLSMEANAERVKSTLVPLLKRNWLFWIPVQYYQFGYVEEPLQIPFLCVAGLAWTFILSAYAGSVKTYDQESVTAMIAPAVPEEDEIEISTVNKMSTEGPKL